MYVIIDRSSFKALVYYVRLVFPLQKERYEVAYTTGM